MTQPSAHSRKLMRQLLLAPSSLRVRLVLAALALLLVTIVSVAWYAASLLERQVGALLQKEQATLVSNTALSIDQKIGDRLLLLSANVRRVPDHIDAASAADFLARPRGLHALFPAGLFLIDPDGRVIADYPSLPERRDIWYGDRDYFREAVATKAPVVSKLLFGRATRRPILAMAVPVIGSEGQVRAVLAGLVDLSAPNILGSVVNGEVAGNDTLVVMRPGDGALIASSDPKLDPLKPASPALLAVLASIGRGERRCEDDNGQALLCAAHSIPAARWLVIATRPADVANAPLRRVRQDLYIVAAVIAILSMLGLLAMVKRMLAPLEAASSAMRGMIGGSVGLEPIPSAAGGEIGRLIDNFNLLVKDRHRYEASLLEQRRLDEGLRLFRAAVDATPDAIYLVDPAGMRVMDVNLAACRQQVKTREELLAMSPEALLRSSREELLEIYHSLIAGHAREPEIFSAISLSGKLRWYEMRRQCVNTEQGHMIVTVVRDVTRMQLLTNDLQRSHDLLEGERDRLRAILNHLQAFVVLLDVDGRILEVNRAPLSSMVLARGEVLGRALDEAFWWARQDDVRQQLRQMVERAAHGTVARADLALQDGHYLDFTVGPLSDANGRVVQLVASAVDITERRAAEDNIRLYASVFEHSGEAIMVTNAANEIIAVNPAFTRLTGYADAEVQGRNPRLLYSGRTPRSVFRQLWDDLHSQGLWQGEVWDKRKDGSTYPKWMTVSSVKKADGEISHFVASFTDITERKQAQAHIVHLAHHDTLTGLPNRLSLQNGLDQALALARRAQRQLAVLFIDMDNFKTINDTLGHAVGDGMLVEVGRRLSHAVREADVVSRFGGDEFVVVLNEIRDEEAAAAVAEKILATLSGIYRVGEYELHSSPSIGMALYPADGSSREALLRNADTAMYRAKALGRKNVQRFHAGMNQAAIERMRYESELRVALERGLFELHYQPLVCARSGRIVGMEALLRLREGNELVLPGKFIAVAEESELIIQIGEWTVDQACSELARWRQAGLRHPTINVNLSARQLRWPQLVPHVVACLDKHGLQASDLALEVTESAAMENPAASVEKLRQLRALGVRLAIDDFGTGYSSLSYLKLLPVDTVKLDGSFVRDIETDPNDMAICEASIALSHSLGLMIVAEGVETEKQREYLAARGCDYLQGYLFSVPLPAAAAMALLQRERDSGLSVA